MTQTDPHERYNAIEKKIDAEQFDEAIEGLIQLVDDQPDFVLAHLALARVYTKTGQHAEAIQHAEKACELEPSDGFNFTALSVTYQRAWAGTGDQSFIQKAEDAMARAQTMQSM